MAVFDHYVAVFTSNLHVVVLEARISEIISAEFKGTTVILMLLDRYDKVQSYNFNCTTESEARSITTVILSVAARMNLFSE